MDKRRLERKRKEEKGEKKKGKREPDWTLRESLIFPLSLTHTQTHIIQIVCKVGTYTIYLL